MLPLVMTSLRRPGFPSFWKVQYCPFSRSYPHRLNFRHPSPPLVSVFFLFSFTPGPPLRFPLSLSSWRPFEPSLARFFEVFFFLVQFMFVLQMHLGRWPFFPLLLQLLLSPPLTVPSFITSLPCRFAFQRLLFKPLKFCSTRMSL